MRKIVRQADIRVRGFGANSVGRERRSRTSSARSRAGDQPRSLAKVDSPYDGLMMRSNANRAAIRIARRTFFIEGPPMKKRAPCPIDIDELLGKEQNRAISGSEVVANHDFYRERGRLGYERSCRARSSLRLSTVSSVTRPASIDASVVSLTTSGSPMTSATVLKGFGTCVLSQLRVAQ